MSEYTPTLVRIERAVKARRLRIDRLRREMRVLVSLRDKLERKKK